MHVIAFKNEILEKNPEAALSLMGAFETANDICQDYYSDPNWSRMAWGRHLFEEERRLLGSDPWANGFAKNQPNLDRFLAYAFGQGLLQRKLTPEELFAGTTLDT